MSGVTRFKGSRCAMELDTLYKNEAFDLTISAKQAYQLSDVFKQEMPLDKFSSHYYNWRRKKAYEDEMKRTNGNDPPDGKCTLHAFDLVN